MIDLGIDLETAGLVLSAVIALIMSLKNNMVVYLNKQHNRSQSDGLTVLF